MERNHGWAGIGGVFGDTHHWVLRSTEIQRDWSFKDLMQRKKKVSVFMKSDLTIFSFVICAIGVISKK